MLLSFARHPATLASELHADICLFTSSRFFPLASVCLVVAALYVAREVLIPVALALLLTFLLAPLSRRLENLRLGKFRITRVVSVLIVVTGALSIVGALGWLISSQVSDLAQQLPSYQSEIVHRIQSIRTHFGQGSMSKAGDVLAKIAKEAANAVPTTQKAVDGGVVASPATPVNPVPVTLVNTTPGLGAWQALTDALYVLEPLATCFIIVILVIFMLTQREDLRDKLIRLMGNGRLTVTTQALDEAAVKVSKYLLTQSIVNGCLGLYLGICFFLLRIPNAALWGLICAILRFIPYVGIWIGGVLPLLLACFGPQAGMSPLHELGPTARPLLAIILFVTGEAVTGNVLEPLLYGAHTGVSSVAILVAAVFWTWLWGTAGLLLSTPLTVCLAVLGKYVPNMEFLQILLGDKPVLTPHERFYQRLLADDAEEARELVRAFLKEKDWNLTRVYEEMLLPTLEIAQKDFDRQVLSDDRLGTVRLAIKELVEDLRAETSEQQEDPSATPVVPPVSQSKESPPAEARLPKGCKVNILILPAHDESDEIAGLMLAHLLEIRGFCAFPQTQDRLASEMVELVSEHRADVVCVSALPPGAVSHSRYLCKRLHTRFPEIKLIVGLWTTQINLERIRGRLGCKEDVQVAGNLAGALESIGQQAQSAMVQPSSVQPTLAQPSLS